jgi:superfamily I DNA/RNA helicase
MRVAIGRSCAKIALGADAVVTHATLAGPGLEAALAHPLDGPLLVLSGPAGTGKTTALLRRAMFAATTSPAVQVLLATPSDAGTTKLGARLQEPPPNVVCRALGDIAFEVLRESRAADGLPDDLTAIDEARAAIVFEGVGAELFSLEWSEFALAEIDPEITGLRAPERFADAAFRLIRKLRASLLSPEEFKSAGLRGAAKFYGRPPNFAEPGLLLATAQKYRDSLRVTPRELERQHERELDLLKVLARLYSAYAEAITEKGCLTPVDAVYEATLLLRRRPDLRARARTRFGYAAIDDAQDLTVAQLGFLGALLGDELSRVTLAGDKEQATRGFAAGARGWDALEHAVTIPFETRYRGTPETSLYRAADSRDEARAIAGDVRKLIADGTSPNSIAVVTRNLACAHAYVDALLAYDIPVDVAGDVSLYGFPVVRDALAALWSAVDPFRHDYLLRNLEAPWLRLCDASIATLCGEAADPQPLLFELPGDDLDEARAGRWDRKRDLRLGRNVTRGDVDGDLPEDARVRLAAFRAARLRWEAAARSLGPGDLARAIFAESVLATLPDGARGRFESGLVARLSAARRLPRLCGTGRGGGERSAIARAARRRGRARPRRRGREGRRVRGRLRARSARRRVASLLRSRCVLVHALGRDDPQRQRRRRRRRAHREIHLRTLPLQAARKVRRRGTPRVFVRRVTRDPQAFSLGFRDTDARSGGARDFGRIRKRASETHPILTDVSSAGRVCREQLRTGMEVRT